MKPYKIFLTFLGLLLLIALLAYLSPKEGVKFKNFTLHFPSIQEITTPEKTEYKDISDIVLQNLPVDTLATAVDTLLNDTTTTKTKKDTTLSDTIASDTTEHISKKEAQRKTSKLASSIKYIEYPENNRTLLNPFFEHLKNLPDNNKLIRILHYGDSQIEGDRISSYLRNQLQGQFGGAGLGLIPVVLPFNTSIPMKHHISKEWERYTVRGKKNFQHQKFGVLMSFSRFTPYYSHYQDEVYEASISLKRSPYSYNRINQYTQCRIFYALNEKPFVLKLEYGGEIADADIIPSTRKLKQIKWSIPQSLNSLTLSFNGDHSPNVYGIALDGDKGIALDNIPLRGSQGTDFTKTDLDFYEKMLEQLNVKLILMHFGVNVVPTARENYSYYEEQFYEQLKTLKELDEELCIIVMGVTDMSRKSGGTYESYPNIEKIRNAQRAAAFKAGCAFWDTYEAMGGKNSMPSWVFADPPLARKDFTHFTYKGSIVIAKMFYKALMHEFLLYQNNAKQPVENEKQDTT